MDFGEVLLHIYASDEVGNQLFDLLQKNEDVLLIEIYCKVIELMWKYGTDEVVNVVDVTLLERLSDDIIVWNRLGEYISVEFKEYINNDSLKEIFRVSSNSEIFSSSQPPVISISSKFSSINLSSFSNIYAPLIITNLGEILQAPQVYRVYIFVPLTEVFQSAYLSQDISLLKYLA